TFVRRSVIDAPAAAVFAWHEQADALHRTIPPGERIRVVEASGKITPGNRVELEMRVGPLPLRWLAEHTDYEAGYQFADVQLRGPFVYWKHWHRVLPRTENQCVLEDQVNYALPLGMLGQAIAGS